MATLLSLLSSAGISALVSAALIFLTKSWISERLKASIQSEYNEKLETHKAQLKAQSDTALEQFKAQLHIAASERSIRLSRVFERTVDTVSGTYERLIAFQDAVAAYTSIFGFKGDLPKEERRKIVAEKYTAFFEFYRPRRPFLPKRTTISINDFSTKLHKTTVDFMINVEQGGDARRRRDEKDDKDTWLETEKFMNEEVPRILLLLEDDLRKILGTHEEG